MVRALRASVALQWSWSPLASSIRYLKYVDFVLRHARYPSAGGLRHPTTYTSRRLLSGLAPLMGIILLMSLAGAGIMSFATMRRSYFLVFEARACTSRPERI